MFTIKHNGLTYYYASTKILPYIKEMIEEQDDEDTLQTELFQTASLVQNLEGEYLKDPLNWKNSKKLVTHRFTLEKPEEFFSLWREE